MDKRRIYLIVNFVFFASCASNQLTSSAVVTSYIDCDSPQKVMRQIWNQEVSSKMETTISGNDLPSAKKTAQYLVNDFNETASDFEKEIILTCESEQSPKRNAAIKCFNFELAKFTSLTDFLTKGKMSIFYAPDRLAASSLVFPYSCNIDDVVHTYKTPLSIAELIKLSRQMIKVKINFTIGEDDIASEQIELLKVFNEDSFPYFIRNEVEIQKMRDLLFQKKFKKFKVAFDLYKKKAAIRGDELSQSSILSLKTTEAIVNDDYKKIRKYAELSILNLKNQNEQFNFEIESLKQLIAWSYTSQNQFDKAEKIFIESLIRLKNDDSIHPMNIISTHQNMYAFYLRQGNYNKSIKHIDERIQIYREQFGPDSAEEIRLQQQKARMLSLIKKKDQAWDLTHESLLKALKIPRIQSFYFFKEAFDFLGIKIIPRTRLFTIQAMYNAAARSKKTMPYSYISANGSLVVEHVKNANLSKAESIYKTLYNDIINLKGFPPRKYIDKWCGSAEKMMMVPDKEYRQNCTYSQECTPLPHAKEFNYVDKALELVDLELNAHKEAPYFPEAKESCTRLKVHILDKENRFEEAIIELDQFLAWQQRNTPEKIDEILRTMSRIVSIRNDLKDYEISKKVTFEILELTKSHYGKESQKYVDQLRHSFLYPMKENEAQSIEFVKESIEIENKIGIKDNKRTIFAIGRVVRYLSFEKNYNEALPYLEQLLPLVREVYLDKPENQYEDFIFFATVYCNLANRKKSKALADEANILKQNHNLPETKSATFYKNELIIMGCIE